MIQSLSTVLILAVIVEILTNWVKTALPLLKGHRSRLVAAVVGIGICFSTQIGILNQLNIAINYNLIDYFITGIVISRGSNAVHDIISVFEKQNNSII